MLRISRHLTVRSIIKNVEFKPIRKWAVMKIEFIGRYIYDIS